MDGMFLIHGLKDMARQVGQQEHQTSPLDFFLWGFVKDQVYETFAPELLQSQLKITTEVINLSQETPDKVWINVDKG